MPPQALTQAAHALRPSSDCTPAPHNESHVTLDNSHVTNDGSPESSDMECEEGERSRSDILKLLQKKRQKPLTTTTPPIPKPHPKRPRLALRSEFLESDRDLLPELEMSSDWEEKNNGAIKSGCGLMVKKKVKKLLFDDSDEDIGVSDGGECAMEKEEDGEMEEEGKEGGDEEDGRDNDDSEGSQDECGLTIVE